MADQEEQNGGAINRAPTQEEQSGQSQPSVQEQEKPIEQVRQLKIRIEELEKQLAEEREKANEYMDRALRAQAEASNVKKRLQQDLARLTRDILRSVVYEQLAVLDSFDRAFTTLPKEFEHFTWVDGIGMIQAQLYSILRQAGVTVIETIGKKFNPIEHEAVAYEETTDQPEDTVTAELQRGYKLHDAVLRPALVKIARSPERVAAGDKTETTSSEN